MLNLTSHSDIVSLLKKFHESPKQAFGQNFLLEKEVIEKALTSAHLTEEDVVVEIGPGLGALTLELSKKVKKVIALEKDPGMIKILDFVMSECSNVEIKEVDALKGDFSLPEYKIVANLPYNITGYFLRHIFEEQKYRPSQVVLLLQEEVVDKICAKPGDTNLVSLGVQVFGKPQKVMRVARDLFFPVPRVDSALVAIDVYEVPCISSDVKKFFSVCNHVFRQKRKKLKNTLISYHPEVKDKLSLIEERIDLNKRPEDLSIEDFDFIVGIVVD